MSRLANIGIGGKALIGISMLIALGIGVIVTSVMAIRGIETTLNDITDVAAPTVETTADVSYLVGTAHRLAIEILADEDPDDILRLREAFDRIVSEHEAAMAELDEIVSDPALETLLEQSTQEWARFMTLAGQMINAYETELQEEATASALMANFETDGEALTSRLLEISDRQEQEMQATEDLADELATRPSTTAAMLNDLIGELFESDYPAFEAAVRLKIIVAVLEGAAREFMASEDIDGLEAIRTELTDTYASAEAEFAVLAERAENETERAQIAALKSDLDAWVTDAEADERLLTPIATC